MERTTNADKATWDGTGLLVWHSAPHPILADSWADLFLLFNSFPSVPPLSLARSGAGLGMHSILQWVRGSISRLSSSEPLISAPVISAEPTTAQALILEQSKASWRAQELLGFSFPDHALSTVLFRECHRLCAAVLPVDVECSSYSPYLASMI